MMNYEKYVRKDQSLRLSVGKVTLSKKNYLVNENHLVCCEPVGVNTNTAQL